MKQLLSRGEIDVVARLGWARSLLAFDFDGTLAPIVADRDQAAMRPATRALLARVCRLYPTAVLSGRSKADVASRLKGLEVKYVIGNHGIEARAQGKAGAALDEARLRLSRLEASLPGVELEDKQYSLAVHYRRSRRKRAARTAIRRAVAVLATPVRLVPGKCVFNVVPHDAPHKGDALRALRAKEGADTALFVGDDVTDEDVFCLDEPGRLVTVRVGRSATSAAAYYLHRQRDVDALLRRLAEARERETA